MSKLNQSNNTPVQASDYYGDSLSTKQFSFSPEGLSFIRKSFVQNLKFPVATSITQADQPGTVNQSKLSLATGLQRAPGYAEFLLRQRSDS